MNERADEALAELASLQLLAPPIVGALESELRTLSPVAERRPARELAILIGAAGSLAAAMLLVMPTRRSLGELPVIWIAGMAAAWMFGFGAAIYLALVPKRGSMMPRWRLAALAAIATSCLFVVLGLLVPPSGPSRPHFGWERLAHGYSCLVLGLAVAIVPVAIGALFLRGSYPVRTRWIAAALGAGGGCLGGLVLHLYCKIADGPHIGLIHGGVVGCAAVISALMIPRLIDSGS